jgi:ABC-2 type transport system ATP-binding protein
MIELKSVCKNYGKTIGIDGLSITVNGPGIHCLLGRNGAGKTTFMKLIAGHAAATGGAVTVNGETVSALAMPDSVHFVESGAAQFNVRLSELFRYASDVNPAFDAAFAGQMANRFRLDLNKRFKQLSFGMKAMASTLIALSSGKEILLLDEPVLGFDPVMRKTFYELLQECCAEKPKTVIVSTHIIDEIEKVAQRLIIIDKGQLVLFCDMSEVDEKAYSILGPAEAVKEATEGLRVIGETTAGGVPVTICLRQTDCGRRKILGFPDRFAGALYRACRRKRKGGDVMKPVKGIVKINLKQNKPAYWITGALLLSGIANEIVMYAVNIADNATVALGSYLLLLPLLTAVLVPAMNFTKLMNLGGKRKDFFKACIPTYALIAASDVLLNIVLRLVLDPLMARHIGILNLLDVFGLMANGTVAAFFQMTAFLLLFMCVLHTLTLAQGHWYGFAADILIIAVISVFTPIAPLRAALAWFFHMIIFHDSALVQIAATLSWADV